MTHLERLRSLLPAPEGESPEGINWDLISASWGLNSSFPSDFRQFMEVYGPGAVEDFLEILEPQPWDEQQVGDGFSAETKTARLTWRMEPDRNFDVPPEPLLIAWGVDSAADILCWDASPDNPDEWPVVVWDRGTGKWSRYDVGMVEFLHRTLRADFDECPLRDTSLWGLSEAEFVSAADEDF
ncbi:SMI1/KNR4 family protein [Streptomyces uncialis]|uniref:SMI1/KNR4 family protein n=1 Tax=Streptomyces uncialis TaxID=1048205 RepID=UPI003824DDC7